MSIDAPEQSPPRLVRGKELPSRNDRGRTGNCDPPANRHSSLSSWPSRSLFIDDDSFGRRRNIIGRSRSIDVSQLRRIEKGLDTSFDNVESNAPSIVIETGKEGQEKRQPRKLVKKSKSLRVMNAAVSQFG